jgi:hypothetical protein
LDVRRRFLQLQTPALAGDVMVPVTQTLQTYIVIGLSLPKDITRPHPSYKERLHTATKKKVDEELYDGLRTAGLDHEGDTGTVILSHLHQDQAGSPGRFGLKAEVGFGSGVAGMIGDLKIILLTRIHISHPECFREMERRGPFRT